MMQFQEMELKKYKHNKGQPLEIGFNSNYLIDVASVLESKDIILMFKDATSPIQIKDENDILSTYIIMPCVYFK